MAESHDEQWVAWSVDDGSGKSSSRQRRTRRREETSNFSFIHFTGEASFRPGRAQKAVRAQAARASSDRRLATIEKRREAKRTNSTDPAAILDTASDDNLSPLPSTASSPLTRARSAPPTLPRDEGLSETAQRNSLPTANAWICDLNGVVQRTLQCAFRTMDRLQILCNTSVLSRNFQEEGLYRHNLMIQCLELLATTATDDRHQLRRSMSRRIVVLLRHKLIVDVQAIIQADLEARKVLASVIALLAGWEAEHGEEHACEYHLRALAGLLPAGSRVQTHSQAVIDLVDIASLCRPSKVGDMPAGLCFYRSLNLLPTCLIDSICTMNDDHETFDLGLQTRYSALAALACRPTDTAYDEHNRGSQGPIHRVSCHIQTAAALLAIIRRKTEASDHLPDQDEDRLSAWYAESLTLETETLLGTVYDEILIWTLCIFCCAVKEPAAEQIKLLRKALRRTVVDNFEGLEALLARYVTPGTSLGRLRQFSGLA